MTKERWGGLGFASWAGLAGRWRAKSWTAAWSREERGREGKEEAGWAAVGPVGQAAGCWG